MDLAKDSATGVWEEDPLATEISSVLVSLAKGVIYKESSPDMWRRLRQHAPEVKSVFARFGLVLEIDDSDNYAFLRQPLKYTLMELVAGAKPDDGNAISPLVPRQPLSLSDSLLLVRLRKRLHDYETSDAEDYQEKLILKEQDLIDMCAEAFEHRRDDELAVRKLARDCIRRIEKMGFIESLESVPEARGAPSGDSAQDRRYEVKRIIKAFIDAQWTEELNKLSDMYLKKLRESRPAESQGEEGYRDGCPGEDGFEATPLRPGILTSSGISTSYGGDLR